MKTHQYIGFNNNLCTCGYVYREIDGVPHLVLKQLPGSTTSITNLVETIVSQLLAHDIFGVDATKLRVFEFYPASMTPLVEWQEVKFKHVAKRQPRKTIAQSIVEFFQPTEQPFVVWNPEWYPVHVDLQKRLSQLDPELS